MFKSLKKKLYIPSDIITKVEIDRKLFIYDDSNSISFNEIEQEIYERICNKTKFRNKDKYNDLIISIIGEYKENVILPFVYLKGSYKNYNFCIELKKGLFKNVKGIYDYLVNEIIYHVDSIIEGYNNEKN